MDSVLGLVRHSGNDGLLRAVEMSLLSTLCGQPFHVHAEGLRGTGKTTVMRAVKRTLPRIRRVKGCLYNCDPEHPHCPLHRALAPEELAALGAEQVVMPFLEISHSAKVGTVVGSIDLARLVDPAHPEAALLPGSIPQAHRGIIFVDEINRLAETAPELADVLLDVMGTKPGRIQIEETGLPAVELSVQVTVWAASNPDEDPGPLEEVRRQLSDRFDLTVYSDRPGDADVVERIIAAAERAERAERPTAPAVGEEAGVAEFLRRITRQAAGAPGVEIAPPLRHQVADLYSRFHLESLRAVTALLSGMRLAACLDGRAAAAPEDLLRVAPLALRHRVDPETMKKVTAHLSDLGPRPEVVPLPVQVQPGRQRFSGIGFGGAAMQPVAEMAAEPAPPHRAEPDREVGPRREEQTQAGSGGENPADPAGPSPSGGWLGRALAGLRRNLGLTAPPPPTRAQRRSDLDRWPKPDRRPLAPRRGRFYQEAGPGGAKGPSDPLKTPPEAPPGSARPISALGPGELIRTEEELNRP